MGGDFSALAGLGLLAGLGGGAALDDSGRLSFSLSGTLGLGIGESIGGEYNGTPHGANGLTYSSGSARIEGDVGPLNFSTENGISGGLGTMLDAEAQLKLSAVATLGTETATYTLTAFDLGC